MSPLKKPFALLALSLLAIGACASPATVAAPSAPAPVVAAAPARADTVAARPAAPVTPPTEAPRNWQLLDETADAVPGVSAERAYRELLGSKQPKRVVIVAVIDGGVDTAHADLKANLWSNPKEIAGNAKDDDGDGYVDDVHGWNFIGGKDGKDVDHDALEVTRLYARCTGKSADHTPTDPTLCARVKDDYEKQRAQVDTGAERVQMAARAYAQTTGILKQALGGDSVTEDRVRRFAPRQPELQQARTIYLQLAAMGVTPKALLDAEKEIAAKLKYQLDPSYDPRGIVGDNYADVSERHYGNFDVMGPDAMHGTHVSGIIGAVRGNGVGIDGVASSVKLMMIRAVPDGDERDKDIANAIRFAVDHGASVINMSFGKPYSPSKSAVDDAVKYADAHGVLMVHAAGNDGADLATSPNFPTPMYLGGGKAQNWIEVGASSWKGGENLATSFSNYGHDQVDLFAPGEDILSTVPGGGYERESGTSMAAPVVTGVAALLMSYYPQLTAADIKRIILATATRHTDQMVIKPGSENGEKVPFGTLSGTGGIINAYAAIRMAETMSGQHP